MGELITRPFAWLMRWLYSITNNYGVAVILFGLAVNIILAPFMAKSKKSMMRQSRLQPKIQELQKRHEGNQQKLNEEMQKLYREEKINPMSGCLWTLIPFPILLALYSVIRQPLSRMMRISQENISAIKTFFTFQETAKDGFWEITLTDIIHNSWDQLKAGLGEIENLMNIDFSFIGLNLGDRPWPKLQAVFAGQEKFTLVILGLVLIPIISAAVSWFTMKVTQKINPSTAEVENNPTTKSMNLIMPIMSIWIAFVMPAAMGIYWIANGLFGMVRDVLLTIVYKKKLDKEDAIKNAERAAREKEMEEKRLATEKLRAEGKTEKNINTSKKKVQAAEKQRSDERKAALDKADRAARRERLGIAENEIPASQVGNRRYARGRAYVPDRYTNPEGAEEATAAAAAASEDDSPIDETMPEEVIGAVETEEVLSQDAVEEAEQSETEALAEEEKD